MIIVIVGPTGVGKTKLSVELAKRLDGEIVNADSMQVYKQLNIGTAKPTEEEKEGINHHLFDIVPVEANYSVYDYQKDARRVIKEISKKEKQIIFVGGTGLYIKAAFYDYKFSDGTSYNEYNNLSNEEILSKIKEYHYDFKEHVHNRKRLVRTLNKLENQEEITNDKDDCLYQIKVIGLTTDREVLYDRINKRVDKMMEEGLLDEVKTFKDHLTKYKSLQTGIGYKEFVSYYDHSQPLSFVVEQIKQNSRRYAKRQYTFFKHQFDVKWFDVNFENFNETIEEVLSYLKEN